MPIELHNADLSSCESVIERGLQSFIEVGQAWQRIRDGRLYRNTHETFEAYCRDRWGFGRNYINKQIAAADVVGTIVPKGLPAPGTESVARELTRAEDPVETWRKAVETAPEGKVTAAHVRSVVESLRKPPPPAEPHDDSSDDQSAPEERDENPEPEPAEPPPVDVVCQEPELEPASERRPITVPPPEPEDDGPSQPMQFVADAWNEMTTAEQDDFLDAVGAVRFSTLEALAEERSRDKEYEIMRGLCEPNASSGRASRMIAAVLDGGDWALARLGLTWSSTEAEAKRAFRQASLQAHPDRGGTNEEFTAISRANAIVMRWLQGKAA